MFSQNHQDSFLVEWHRPSIEIRKISKYKSQSVSRMLIRRPEGTVVPHDNRKCHDFSQFAAGRRCLAFQCIFNLESYFAALDPMRMAQCHATDCFFIAFNFVIFCICIQIILRFVFFFLLFHLSMACRRLFIWCGLFFLYLNEWNFYKLFKQCLALRAHTNTSGGIIVYRAHVLHYRNVFTFDVI